MKIDPSLGPWVLPNGNFVYLAFGGGWQERTMDGKFIGSTVDLPADVIPLVPQTEVDAVKTERDRWHKLLSAIGRELETDSGGWFYDDLPKVAAGLKTEVVAAYATRDEWESNYERVAAELTEAHIRIARLEDDLANADAELEDRQAAPSLPAVDFKDTEESLPQKLRAAAYLVDMQFDRLRCGDRPVASILYDEADRLDREQAEKAKRDKVAQVVAEAVDNIQFKLDAHELEQVTQAVLDDPRITVSLNEASVAGDAF